MTEVTIKRCPNPDCPTKTEAIGPQEIEELFNWRNVRGKQRPQSWCTACRKKKARELSRRKTEQRKAIRAGAKQVNHAAKLKKRGPVGVLIPADKRIVRAMYMNHYPCDKAGPQRALKFMVQRLLKKLKGARLEPKLKKMFSEFSGR